MTIRPVLLVSLLVLPSAALAQVPAGGKVEASSAAEALLESQTYRFAGTQWGASSVETKAQLETHGFTFDQAGPEGDLIFTGTLNDRPAIVVALFAADRLAKIVISMPTEEETTLPVYREMKSILGGLYGAPEVDVESYAYPFAGGKHVGYETAALRVGKATIGAMWQARGEALGIRISERLIVSAHYESQDWKQETERRAQRKIGD
jgi:hypothetical protein